MNLKRALVVGLVSAVLAGAVLALLIANGRRRSDGGHGDGAPLVSVVVTTEAIPMGERLDRLIRRDVLAEVQVPAWAVIDGAVRDISQLEGMKTTAPIEKHEQIPSSFLTDDVHPVGEDPSS